MPLYEYRCDDCGHRFEILQKLGEGAGGLACPHCAGAGLAKQYSTFAAATGGAAERSAESGCGTSSCGCGPFGCGSEN